MYNVILSKKASNFIEKLDKSYKNKIKDVFLSLKENPFSYPHRKIKGEIYIYRIRIGKYRILFHINDADNIIIILKIDKRSKIYK